MRCSIQLKIELAQRTARTFFLEGGFCAGSVSDGGLYARLPVISTEEEASVFSLHLLAFFIL